MQKIKLAFLSKYNILNLSFVFLFLASMVFRFKNNLSIWPIWIILSGFIIGILIKEKNISDSVDLGVNYSLIFGFFSGIGFFLVMYFVLESSGMTGAFFSFSTLLSIFLCFIAFTILHFIGLSVGIFLKDRVK